MSDLASAVITAVDDNRVLRKTLFRCVTREAYAIYCARHGGAPKRGNSANFMALIDVGRELSRLSINDGIGYIRGTLMYIHEIAVILHIALDPPDISCTQAVQFKRIHASVHRECTDCCSYSTLSGYTRVILAGFSCFSMMKRLRRASGGNKKSMDVMDEAVTRIIIKDMIVSSILAVMLIDRCIADTVLLRV